MLELQNKVLERIAKGEPLAATLEALCLLVEIRLPEVKCSVLRVENGRLHPLAAPSLPHSYSQALDNLEVGPAAGSCGTAAFYGVPVIVTDIATDGRWAAYRDLALPLGLLACWSTPVISAGRVIATFALYFQECRRPDDGDKEIIETCTHLCAIAIERDERVRERERLTYTDALTGEANRARFNEVLEELQTANRTFGLLLADIDNLKLVNDTFGHGAGDALIRTVARRIASVVPPERTFRLGGDEFAVILDGGGMEELAACGDAILRAVKRPAQCDKHVVFPSMTAGGAVAGDGDPRQNADVALYHGKSRHRGQFTAYYPGMGTALTRRFRAIRDVGIALAERRIEAHYQPIVRLDTGEVVGFEALCRMRTPAGETVAAAHFHEAMLDGEIALQLTERMLDMVTSDMRRWLDLGLPLQHVGINLSAADFHTGNLRAKLDEHLIGKGVPLDHVILEVTESVYLGPRDHTVGDEIRALREQGLRVALDDFGTGYASLTHLLTVPVDIIKIDKSFVDRLISEEPGAAIVEGLIGIAHRLGIKVVAEGIETEEQASHLLAMGCILGQGFVYSRAVGFDAATELLRTRGQKPDDAGENNRPPLRHDRLSRAL
ncbi:GGDEF domain-containing protein [Rhizobium sp. BE258]|jgi:diguanylate cyclase (GGDEF)-like protein|uniref:bifunctional diguanylate cyclase/phosphodiesterase n=2 Tax=Pseudomonadati TaxID=3379134 RepID=UPI000DD8DD1A|nr:GGDEF domain-containing protein [Rhizobium sp. BE258]MDR7147997.1 diguanylate cyclase (GGDEF)-like protein [Rhizobium sp. BE258]